MKIAIDLFESARLIMRQNLRRRHLEATDTEIDAMLTDWLHKRPGAEQGDATGRPSHRFDG